MTVQGADATAAPGDLNAGRVGRAHGLDGSFYVTGSRPGLLAIGGTVSVADEEREILRVAGTAQRPIVRLAGVADRDAARAIHGRELTVRSSAVRELTEDEWWAEELEGCTVVAGDRVLGKVGRLLELPSCEALEVLAGGGGEPLLVPMVKDAIRRVAIADRTIEIDLDFLGLADTSDAHGGDEPA